MTPPKLMLAALALLAGAIGISVTAFAEPGAAIHETVTPQFQHKIPNLPGKTFTSIIVEYPPGAKSVSHRHGESAFVYAYVLSGAIRSQVNDEPAKVYRAGENWFEPPAAHHKMSENVSSTEPARLLVVFIANTGEILTTLDPQ